MRNAAALLVALCGAAAACRHPAQTAPAPAPLVENYCWWTVRRTPLPVDTVVARFARAFARVGLTGVSSTRRGDTSWVHAGPTPLGTQPLGARYASRLVAYQSGDSTHFRYYVALGPPPGGWAVADTADGASTRRQIGFCGAIVRAAAVPSIAANDPGAEEKLELWTRTP